MATSGMFKPTDTADELRSRLWLAVLLSLYAYCFYQFLQWRRRYQADEAFGLQNGCLPVETKLLYHWPFALDVLKCQYDALPSQRLFAFQSQYIDKMPNMQLRLFGQVGYLTTDPRNIEAILSTHFEDWGMGARSPGLYPLLGEGNFTQDGRPWKRSREMLRRHFARIGFKNLSIFDEHVENLVTDLAGSAGVVDLQPAFFRFTLATTTALIFGESVSNLGDDEKDTFANAFDYASCVSALRLRLADFCWAYNPKEVQRACGTVKRYATHFVNEALKIKHQNNAIEPESDRLSFIQDLHDELGDLDLVRDQLVNVLIAGRDTTACLMSWTFFLLVRHPRVLERLRQEIHTLVGDEQQITRNHVARLTYLKCVLNKTLQLYPQLPVNIRVAFNTTVLPNGGGPDSTAPILIRKGTGVGYSVYHMHRRIVLCGPDADEYRPERWEGTELENIGWGFMPFHGGPRICLGRIRAFRSFLQHRPHYPSISKAENFTRCDR